MSKVQSVATICPSQHFELRSVEYPPLLNKWLISNIDQRWTSLKSQISAVVGSFVSGPNHGLDRVMEVFHFLVSIFKANLLGKFYHIFHQLNGISIPAYPTELISFIVQRDLKYWTCAQLKCVCAKQYIWEIGEAHKRSDTCFTTCGCFVTQQSGMRHWNSQFHANCLGSQDVHCIICWTHVSGLNPQYTWNKVYMKHILEQIIVQMVDMNIFSSNIFQSTT
jgi:hypothetical protein